VRRRDFITLLGGTAAAWSLTVGAQGDAKIRRIGILANEKWPPIDGFRDGLRGLGYVEGLNLDLEYRYVEGEAGRYATVAAELVRLPVEVIVTWGDTRQSCRQKSDRYDSHHHDQRGPDRCRSRSRARLPGRKHHWALYSSRRARRKAT
jgi:hypothetical protein